MPVKELVDRERVLAILEETKTFVLKTGRLDTFGPLLTVLDRVRRLPVYQVPEKKEEKR